MTYAWTFRHKLSLELGDCFGDLLLHLRPDAWGSEEEAVEYAADGGVGIERASEDAAAFELKGAFPRPSEQEEEEY